MKIMTRSYTLKQRGEDRDRTRQKIVEAAIDLRQKKGLKATSMADIAERAGVARVTVYRHFPDEAALAGACSGQYMSRHPLPNLKLWRSIKDPTARLQLGLSETYAYHRETEAMMASVLKDARDFPLMAPYHAHWGLAANILVAPWHLRGHRKRLLHAGIAHALAFETWCDLTREQGLTDKHAVDLMLRLACDCA
jgi:AcrR family transcriptional regulator